MTGLLHEKEFSRKSFLKGGGAMVVGFSIAGAGLLPGKAQAGAVSPFASNGPADLTQIDSFIVIHADNTASILTGRIEMGHGSSVGFLQIAGEELNMDMSQLKFVNNDTAVTPNTGTSNANSGIAIAGLRVRSAAAAARDALLGLASTQLGVPVANLAVESGVVSGGGKSVSYGQLMGGKLFNVQMSPTYLPTTPVYSRGGSPVGAGLPLAGPANESDVGLYPGMGPAKPVSQYTLVTTRVPRIDIPAKVIGTFTYVHNIRVPGMLHGRWVRPRGQGNYGDGTNPAVLSVDESSISHIPGARVVRRGNFLGVVAPHEYDAIQAAAQLKVKWADPPVLPGSGNLYKQMRIDDSAGLTPAAIQRQDGDVNAAFASAAHVVSATYKWPYQGHALIGPCCAVADVTPNGAVVYCGSQDCYAVQKRLGPLLNLPLNQIRVRFYEGASNYGNSLNRYEGPTAAAIMSQLAGAPVRLQLMRWDDHGWDNPGPPTMVDLRGGVDANGKIVGIDFTAYALAGSQVTVNPTDQMVGTTLTSPGRGTINPNSFLVHSVIPNSRFTSKSLQATNASYIKAGTMRAPYGPQVGFGFEQMMDELAHAANMDPYQFRLQNLSKSTIPGTVYFRDRWLGVLNAVTKAANWQPKVAASSLSNETVVTGRGLALGTHEATAGTGSPDAMVADVEVNKKTGKIVVKHLYAAEDAGLAVNPAMIENQIIGAAIQSASRVLLEEVQFNKRGVTSLDWVTYPIMRFKDAPKVTAIVVQRLDYVSEGGGDVPTATVAAIANAFFDATGVRLRQAPMTSARVRGVLKAAGVA